jgi:hypothetical protein
MTSKGDTISWRCANGNILTGKVLNTNIGGGTRNLISVKIPTDRCPYPVYEDELVTVDN